MTRAGIVALLAICLCPASFAATCSVSSSGVAFGTYDVIGHHTTDTIGQVTVSCSGSRGEAVSFAVSLSTLPSRTAGRRLSGGEQSLYYELYLDAGRTLVLGDGTAGTSVIKGSMILSAGHSSQSFAIYGRMPMGQNKAVPSQYTDIATLKLTW
jgi:spore coat protein U-like protein